MINTAALSLSVDGTKHEIDILKLRTNSLKRYTQPGTKTDLVATAVFHDRCLFWKLDEKYYIELRLKSRHSQQKLSTDSKKNGNLDCALWWYQCWSVYGIREHPQIQQKNQESTPSEPSVSPKSPTSPSAESEENGQTVSGQQSGIRLKPFIAVHDNAIVGDLKRNLKRIVLILHKKQNEEIPEHQIKETEIRINGLKQDITKKKKSKKRRWNQVDAPESIKNEVVNQSPECAPSSNDSLRFESLEPEHSQNILGMDRMHLFQNEMFQEHSPELKMQCNGSMKEEFTVNMSNTMGMEMVQRLKQKIAALKNERNQYREQYIESVKEHDRFRQHVFETTHKIQYYATQRDQEIQSLSMQNEELRRQNHLLMRNERIKSLLSKQDVSALTPLGEISNLMHFKPSLKRQRRNDSETDIDWLP